MNQILILMENLENRRLLAQYLQNYYQVRVGDSVLRSERSIAALNESFDLCLLDGVALHHLSEEIQAIKQKEKPIFLPVLLVTISPDVKLMTRNLWETVDELITKPIEKMELQARVEMLLRARRLSLQLEAALTREREMNELKSRLMAIVSHEFRNPLHTILGFAQILERTPQLSPEKQADLWQRIKNSVRHMMAVFDNILTISKSDANKVVLQPTLIALKPFCVQIFEELKLSEKKSSILDLICENNTLEAQFDPTLLRQILTNLLSNALKYSPINSTVRLTIKPRQDAIIFQIQDQGIGISQDDQHQLFHSFYRASNVGSISGTGLGLVIVKQAVERQGGTISVDSEINVGTTFTVTLPISSPEQDHTIQNG